MYSDGDDLGTVGPDAYFGELTIQNGRSWSATVKAETTMRVLVLNAGEFAAHVREAPSVALHLARGRPSQPAANASPRLEPVHV